MKPQAKPRYVMDTEKEIDRLEKQASIPAYDVKKEFGNLPRHPGVRILDAGCGTGVVTRYLAGAFPASRIDGCDLSQERLDHAKKVSSVTSRISYFVSDLEKIEAPDDIYDLVVSRYVFEHLASPAKAAQDLFRVTKPGGLVRIVDFDGLLLNFFPCSDELNRMVEHMLRNLPVDLFIGRKIPHLLAQVGFEKISWNVEVHGFHGDHLEAERVNIAERVTGALPVLEKVFESNLNARRFEKLFLKELSNPEVVLFYNKFIVDGRKPGRRS